MLLPSISSVYGIEKITNQRAASLANLSLLYKTDLLSDVPFPRCEKMFYSNVAKL